MNGRAVIEEEYRRVREAGGSVVPEDVVKAWLRERGLPVPPGTLISGVAEALDFARASGYPLVAKITGDRILHKTEIGGVITGISTEDELSEAAGVLLEKGEGVEGFRGVLVERQEPAGIEIIVGLQRDPHFGPVLMVGTGGVYTDLLGDVSFRLLPLTRSDIVSMLGELKGRTLLDGFRGEQPCDLDGLVDTIMDIASFGEVAAPYMESADFNPVIARPDGVSLVDAKLVLSEEVTPDPFSFDPPDTRHLGSFFNPGSVAVIGASATEGKIGNVIVDSLANHEFEGRVYPVNPNREEILGARCYPSLEELPEPPELAVMVVDLAEGPDLLRRLADLGVHNLLIVSGGGKELGGDREQLEAEMSRLARELDIRVVGPNCIGAFDGGTRFDSFFHSHRRLARPPAGPLSFITQSGTWGCCFLEEAAVVGVARMVSYGNRLDVDEGDLIACLAEDPRTSVIASYVEGLENGRKYLAAARKAAREYDKPVVVFKTGRTGRSASAAVSHTGAYGGTYGVYEGVFTQAGIVSVDSFSELYAASKALALQPPAGGPGAAMVSNGAGPMVNAIDLFAGKGLELVRLRRKTVKEMREHFSFFYIVENPVDVTGSASAEDYEYVIRRLMEDEEVDVVMPYFVFQDTPLDESIVERMEVISAEYEKPVVACSVGGPYTERMTRRLEAAGVPVVSDVGDWVAAAAALVRWGELIKPKERA